jgi:sugar phosphate isomerase/epimerase
MLPGVFARTYAGTDPAPLFARIAADGFRGVQFNLTCVGLAPLPASLPDGVASSVGQLARAAGLTLCALSGTYNMVHPDPARRGAARSGFANVLSAARAMGAPIVTLCTGSRDPQDMWKAHPGNAAPDAWSDLRRELDHALAAAEAAGLVLAIEPEPGNVVADAALARRLLDEVGSARLGIVLDAANILGPETLARQAEVVAHAVDLLGPDIVLTHAKDIDAAGRVVAAGRGAVDLAGFVQQVRAAGFDGPLIGHGFAETDAPAVARHLASIAGGPP